VTSLPPSARQALAGSKRLVMDFEMSYDSQGRLDVLTYPDSGGSYRFKADYDYFGHVNAAIIRAASFR
jgi:hypothetical protein